MKPESPYAHEDKTKFAHEYNMHLFNVIYDCSKVRKGFSTTKKTNEIVVDIRKVCIKRKDSRILAKVTCTLFATSFKLFAAHSHHDKQFVTHKVIMANRS